MCGCQVGFLLREHCQIIAQGNQLYLWHVTELTRASSMGRYCAGLVAKWNKVLASITEVGYEMPMFAKFLQIPWADWAATNRIKMYQEKYKSPNAAF